MENLVLKLMIWSFPHFWKPPYSLSEHGASPQNVEGMWWETIFGLPICRQTHIVLEIGGFFDDELDKPSIWSEQNETMAQIVLVMVNIWWIMVINQTSITSIPWDYFNGIYLAKTGLQPMNNGLNQKCKWTLNQIVLIHHEVAVNRVKYRDEPTVLLEYDLMGTNLYIMVYYKYIYICIYSICSPIILHLQNTSHSCIYIYKYIYIYIFTYVHIHIYI